jgi:hypothetical protein
MWRVGGTWCVWFISVMVMASKLAAGHSHGHSEAEARADINSVDGCLSFSGSISIQYTG